MNKPAEYMVQQRKHTLRYHGKSTTDIIRRSLGEGVHTSSSSTSAVYVNKTTCRCVLRKGDNRTFDMWTVWRPLYQNNINPHFRQRSECSAMYFIRNSEDISLDLYNEIKSLVDDSISCWPMYNIDKSSSNSSSSLSPVF